MQRNFSLPAYGDLPSFTNINTDDWATFLDGKDVYTKLGIFSHSIGLKMNAYLLAAAASATSPDGSSPVRPSQIRADMYTSDAAMGSALPYHSTKGARQHTAT